MDDSLSSGPNGVIHIIHLNSNRYPKLTNWEIYPTKPKQACLTCESKLVGTESEPETHIENYEILRFERKT